MRERPTCCLRRPVKSRKPSSSSPVAAARRTHRGSRCSTDAAAGPAGKSDISPAPCEGGRRAFPGAWTAAPQARRQGNVVPWQDAPICGVDRFHSHQPSLSLRAAYCQTTRSISTQRPLDSGDFFRLYRNAHRMCTGLQRACIVQNLLQHHFRSIGVDIRSRCAVHRYLRSTAPRPLEAVGSPHCFPRS